MSKSVDSSRFFSKTDLYYCNSYCRRRKRGKKEMGGKVQKNLPTQILEPN